MTADLVALADQVRAHGYAVWPSFITPERCRVLREAAADLATRDAARHYPRSTRVWDLYQYGATFTDVVADRRLSSVLDDLLGPGFLLSDYSLNVVHPGQPVDDWHIDYPYNEMRSLATGGVLGLQCVLALDAFNEQNGATQLVPGSHLPPTRPGGSLPGPATTFAAQPGDLLIMTAATWHRSGLNAASESRTAVLMSFGEKWIRPLADPVPADQWTPDPRLLIMLGLQRPAETINGVPV
jgi:ectoine hydroxylase-related dioxygenase (phytanoyl-CoA dioxygenase family)